MKKFIDEFKKFIAQGNVMDMAIGIIIGGAFKAIVDSLVADLINPLLGIFGGVNFSDVALRFNDGKLVFGIGNFITSIINFLIMAFVLFMILKAFNAAKDALPKTDEKPAAPTTKICPYCRSEIAIEATRCPHCTSQLDKQA